MKIYTRKSIRRQSLNIKKMTAWYAAVIFFVAADRLLKITAVKGSVAELINGLLKFNLAKNYYIAFSLPISGAWLNSLIALVILLLIYYFARSRSNGRTVSAFCLFTVALGAAGNLFDRLKYGYVVDYFDLKYFTVFNLADVLIVSGLAAFIFTKKKQADRTAVF